MAGAPGADQSLSRKIGSTQDVAAGLMFLLVGAGGLWIARDYPLGTAVRIGTGVFPRILCWGLVGLGVIILIQGFVGAGERLTRWSVRPLIFVSLAVLAFALLLEPLGLVVATLALLLLGAAGSPETRWREVTIFAVVMAAVGVILFVEGLGLPLKVLPF